MSLKLTESGDTELWVVSGADWRLPVYAHPYKNGTENFFQVQAAMPFSSDQFMAVDQMLSPHSIVPYETFWLVRADVLVSTASKAPGITPGRYVMWGRKQIERPAQMAVPRNTSKFPNAAFLSYVNSRYNLASDNGKLRYIWFVLCNEMARWLHHEQKPIELGFATIHAVPYRANWKQILLSKFPKFMDLVRKFKNEPAIMANLALTGFPSELRRGDLASMTGSTVGWSLEVEPHKSWAEFVEESENKLLIEKGRTSYVAYWNKRVDRAERTAVALFRSFVEATTRPCATVRETGKGGHRSLVPFVPKGTIHQSSLDCGANVVVTDGEPTGSEAALVPADESLPEVQVIRFDTPELRDTGVGARN